MEDVIFTAGVLVIAIILSIIHLLSEKVSKFMKINHYKVLSLSAGTMIALIFLILLPEVLHLSDEPIIFLSILMGFVIFHISEKYLYQHVKNKKELLKDLKELHVVGFFIDNFIIGFILVTTLKISGFNGIIIILPIILHTISSSIAMEHIHERARTRINKIILSLSPIIGALVALLIIIEGIYLALIIAFLVGMLLKTVNRDVVPQKEKGYPHLFILGVLIVFISWLLII